MNNKLYPLTHNQKGMWYTEKIYPETSVGIVAGTFRMKGNINYDVLKKAINAFVRDNDAMRIRIIEEKGEPRQYIADYEPFEVNFVDFCGKEKNELYDWEREQTMTPMDVIVSPLFSFIMIKVSDNEGGYLIKTHHLISDAWSMTLIVNKIAKKYFELLKGIDKVESEPSYIDYIKSEEEYEKSEKYKKDHDYWMNKYEQAPEITTLKPRTSKEISIASKRRTFVLPEKLCRKLYTYSKENRVSIFSLYMSALSMYLYRITGKEKLNLGTIILNRGNKKEKDTMGMFIETIPVALDLNGEVTFADFSKKVTGEMMSLMRHQSYPFDVLQEELRKKHGFDDVLYDIILSYQNAKFLNKEDGIDYKCRWHFCGYQSNSLTVHVNDRENEGRLIIDYDYITDLFYDKEIEFLHTHIERLLWHAIDNPVKALNKLEMVSETEKNKILNEFNDTKVFYPDNKVVHELIEETAKRLLDKTAIICQGESITYDEFNKRANKVANTLRKSGIGRNDIVGLMADRSIDMMVGLFGIMKSGAAYLPIDPEYPAERIEYMLENSKAKVLVTEKKLENTVKIDSVKKFIVEEDFTNGSIVNPKVINNPDDLIYVIYTSGSTGNPKGVMLKHRNICNFIEGTCNQIGFNENKVIVSVTTICFDIFVLESWLSFARGLTVILATEKEQNRPKLFNELCVKNKVNMIQTTPSRTALLISHKESLDYVKNITEFMVGGEPFPETLLQDLRKISNAKIYNMYGPTETAVWSSIKDLTKEDSINIGRPMANTQFYILDKTLNLCPIGMIGNLYIGGTGLSKGYLGNEKLTNEKFIENPFKKDDVIYNTGDLGRFMSDGEIKHMGRSDFQVKIRGYRIELGDIQRNLAKIDGIKDAIIRPVDYKYLIAYLICEDNLSVTKIKSELLKVLPQYMIPAYFVRLDSLPYTPNGKVDVKKLPSLNDVEIMRDEFIEAESETEKRLLKIWTEVLNLTQISKKDDFFDIGGDSLGAINLTNAISEEFNVALAVKEVYKNPTIETMASYLEENASELADDKYSDVVLLKRGDKDNNLFVIHAGNGSVAPYANMISRIETKSNCIGIEFPEVVNKNTYHALAADMSKTVSEYIERIRKIQPHGPYKFLGWCVGCSTILEIIKQLKEIDEETEVVYLIAGLAPSLGTPMKFDVGTEKMIMEMLNLPINVKDKVLKGKTSKEVWDILIDNIKEIDYDRTKKALEKIMYPLELARATQDYEHADLKYIIKNFNMIRTMIGMHSVYTTDFATAVKSYYFNPAQDKVIKDARLNEEVWKSFFTNMEVINIDGDHFSFFERETDEEFVKILNEKLN